MILRKPVRRLLCAAGLAALLVGLAVLVSSPATGRSTRESEPAVVRPAAANPEMGSPGPAVLELKARAHRSPSGRKGHPLTAAPIANPQR
ncbi:MAG: hypothetical protein AB1486_12130 [Planctomycetota bacterium]